jgi:DNA-nicking Smr family endonuclease
MPRRNPDTGLWQQATRDVKPLAPRAARALAPKPPPEPTPDRPAILLPTPAATVSQTVTLDRFAGIDRRNAERLKRGKHKIEARLDLHGMTQDEAHRTLLRFVRSARFDGKRCVLVITGRGSLGGGVLKAAVPRWFEEADFRPHLLAISPAQPRDGGTGALYVMLRRNVTDRPGDA